MGNEDDAFAVAVIEQVLAMLERIDIGRFDRHEHQHEVGAVDGVEAGVALAGQLIDMLAHGTHMFAESLLLGCGRCRSNGAVVSEQRNLAVDDDVLVVRQLDQIVGLTLLTGFIPE